MPHQFRRANVRKCVEIVAGESLFRHADRQAFGVAAGGAQFATGGVDWARGSTLALERPALVGDHPVEECPARVADQLLVVFVSGKSVKSPHTRHAFSASRDISTLAR